MPGCQTEHDSRADAPLQRGPDALACCSHHHGGSSACSPRSATAKASRDASVAFLSVCDKRLQGKRVIWLHAVSVGEVLAASRLIVELETALGEGWRVVISTTTRTGQALARERFGADRVFYFPLDFAFAVRAYMRALKPAALVLMESELWPRVLHECKRAHIPIVVVNARVSDRSFARATRVRGIWGRMLRKVTLWLAQSEEDARRLCAMGAVEGATCKSAAISSTMRSHRSVNAVARQIKAWAGEPFHHRCWQHVCITRSTHEVESEESCGRRRRSQGDALRKSCASGDCSATSRTL